MYTLMWEFGASSMSDHAGVVRIENSAEDNFPSFVKFS